MFLTFNNMLVENYSYRILFKLFFIFLFFSYGGVLFILWIKVDGRGGHFVTCLLIKFFIILFTLRMV